MKARLCAILLCMAFLALGLQAKTYTVENLPNVQLQDSTKLFVNPDGIISDGMAARIDTLLCDARRQSSAEVVAVIVDEVEGDIDDFATELFNTWGIGKKDVNNGIVILVAKDRRRGVIRTGYGAEGLLPDVICKRILRDTMTPYFKEGDYEGGMLAGVSEVHRLVTDPAAIEELMTKGDNDDDSGAGMLLGILAVAGVGGVAGAAYYKSAAKKCKKCKTKMVEQTEEETYKALSDSQKFEKDHNSRTFRMLQCPECGEQKITSTYVGGCGYEMCTKCHTYAYHYRKAVVTVAPSASAAGEAEQWGDCEYCKYSCMQQKFTIPKTNKAYAVGDEYVVAGAIVLATGLITRKSSSSSSHSSGGSSSRSRGGSFGGGRSGGGGASHGW